MNCPNCGAVVTSRAKFCDNCGTRIAPAPSRQVSQPVYTEQPAYTVQPAYTEQPAGARFAGNPYTGFSGMVDTEPVQAALKKQKSRERIISFVYTLIPLIGFLIYGAVSSSMEIGSAFTYGLFLTVIFAVIMLYVFLRRALARPFEGTVSDLQRKFHSGSKGRSRSKYLVYVDCGDGKRRKKEVNLSVFEYLKNGDRVRYLPKFNQPFEKYKTAADTETICMFCGRKQSLSNDSCEFCHSPLIK